MRVPLHRRREQNEGFSEKYLYFEYDDNENNIDDVDSGCKENEIGIRWDFRNERWNNLNFVYDPMPKPFCK